MQQKVLASGHFLFDNKPLIIRPWKPDIELEKEEIKNVPAWIRLNKLPLKFWGHSLKKISGLVGKYIKSDTATEEKTRLGFARVMVELQLGQSFPNKIKFFDERKQLVEVSIDYEWKSRLCTKCKQLGHEKENCRRTQKDTKSTDTISEVTPITSPMAATNGTISPIRQLRVTRQGLENVSRNLQVSPTYIEALCGSRSPKEGIAIDGKLMLKFGFWNVRGMNKEVKQREVLEYNAQLIHMSITDKYSQVQFFHTIVYAFNGVNERESLWSRLNFFGSSIQGPWTVCGDFNCVLLDDERLGGKVTNAESEPFQNCLDFCGLMDIQAIGAYYTWNNKQPPLRQGHIAGLIDVL
ncbi:uncharacterized protein LOC141651407 [Silene latifolia]|uniref:uncharacterized protein LOC141651407 n=1 Tax=Silene latifolia TaxID=37657 RepID=UPI003D76A970